MAAWRPGRTVLYLVGTLAAASVAACGGAPDVSVEEARREAEEWRARHEADYRRDWSTIAGLHFLEDGANTAGSDRANRIVLPESTPSALGSFVLEAGRVTFHPAPESGAQIDGAPVAAPVALRDDGDTEVDRLTVGNVRMVIHRSGARKSLRVWDPNGPLAQGFLGFRWFEIQPSYRVIGRFIADAAPRPVRVMNTFGDLDDFTTEGVVEFTLNGETLRLRPFTTRPGRLYFVFRDASSGQETYEAARFLYADLRDDGTAVLDFNQAYNPPCAFNPFTTCPIPLPENRMPVKVLAGERAYPAHVALPGA